jgi:hypothetical protein
VYPLCPFLVGNFTWCYEYSPKVKLTIRSDKSHTHTLQWVRTKQLSATWVINKFGMWTRELHNYIIHKFPWAFALWTITNSNTNSKQTSFWEADSRSVGQEIPLILVRMEAEVPLTCSHKPASGPYPETLNPQPSFKISCKFNGQFKINALFSDHTIFSRLKAKFHICTNNTAIILYS